MTDNTGTVDTVIDMTVPGNKLTKQYNTLYRIIRLILLYNKWQDRLWGPAQELKITLHIDDILKK